MKIKTAIIPVAGKGTRFLPATKETPKEMIPIIDRPMIHYVVDEAIQSGIEKVVFVTNESKETIEKYFRRNYELEKFLENGKKFRELDLIKNIGNLVEVRTVLQSEQLGLGHAVLCAMSEISSKNERFAVLLGDDIILSEIPATKQLMTISDQFYDHPVIGVMEVPLEDVSKYGVISPVNTEEKERKLLSGQELPSGHGSSLSETYRVIDMVEKPSQQNTPSLLATPGRYIFDHDIFGKLRSIKKGSGGEYQLTDAIKLLCKDRPVYAHKFIGERFDTGNIFGYLNATLEFSLRETETKNFMIEIMKEKLKRYEEGK